MTIFPAKLKFSDVTAIYRSLFHIKISVLFYAFNKNVIIVFYKLFLYDVTGVGIIHFMKIKTVFFCLFLIRFSISISIITIGIRYFAFHILNPNKTVAILLSKSN